jgi:hypothetical protein
LRKNKYGNISARVFGISFRSKAERDHALFLESERQAGRIKKWEYEVSYDLFAAASVAVFDRYGNKIDFQGPLTKFGAVLIGKHKPDFTVTLNDDRKRVDEIKGGAITKTEAWQLRRKIFQANYPEIEYRVIETGRREWPVIQF